jgi:hypothetical protein
MRYLFTIFLISFCFADLSAQAPHPILDNLVAYRNGSKIELKWTIKGGSTCNGTNIHRSEDLISFTEIGEIAGICGSSAGPEQYSFTDESPLQNKTNHYRLELGSGDFSNAVSVDFTVLNTDGYLAYPNPMSESCIIYFDNPNQEEHILRLLDLSGRIVFVSSAITADSVTLFRNELKPGIYIFIIEKDDKLTARGKISIQ